MSKSKFFRDPVHNYIEIPENYCKDFIDTYLFQRLRAIEQTSMRCLYPAARHDRFIHSIGTYHIASQIFASLEKNIARIVNRKTTSIISIKHTFLLAALLHDCAHSPFSHTGEEFSENYCDADIRKKLCNLFCRQFKLDLAQYNRQPATHELASAYIACKYFDKALKKYNVNKEQFSRMITGVLNTKTSSKVVNIYNALIKLLNGFIIDADRLDYLIRDTWASGVSNANVDLERLIKGIILKNPPDLVSIKNSALSCLINAAKARDFIYQWIFPHHKVVFYTEVLKGAIAELISALSTATGMPVEIVGQQLFSPMRMLQACNINNEHIYMPTDGDLVYLMKKYCSNGKFTRILLSRCASYYPLWKSVAEYESIFCMSDKQREKLFSSGDLNIKFFKRFTAEIKEKLNNCIVIRGKVKTTIKDLLELEIKSPISDKINLKNLISKPVNMLPYVFVYVDSKYTTRGNRHKITLLKNIFKDTLDQLLK